MNCSQRMCNQCVCDTSATPHGPCARYKEGSKKQKSIVYGVHSIFASIWLRSIGGRRQPVTSPSRAQPYPTTHNRPKNQGGFAGSDRCTQFPHPEKAHITGRQRHKHPTIQPFEALPPTSQLLIIGHHCIASGHCRSDFFWLFFLTF